jgi:hypothetical protein
MQVKDCILMLVDLSHYQWEERNKSTTTIIIERQLKWMKARATRVKVVRCDNAKEQMAPLKKMCWENEVMVEYVAPYTPQQNGKVERQFPTDVMRANAMLDLVQLSPSMKMMLRKEAIRYAATMANISIKENTSPHEKFFGVPSALKPEHCLNFGRIGYVTHLICPPEQTQA